MTKILLKNTLKKHKQNMNLEKQVKKNQSYLLYIYQQIITKVI